MINNMYIYEPWLPFPQAIFHDFMQLHKTFLNILKSIQTLRLKGYTSDE